jgi:hypothetical protein
MSDTETVDAPATGKTERKYKGSGMVVAMAVVQLGKAGKPEILAALRKQWPDFPADEVSTFMTSVPRAYPELKHYLKAGERYLRDTRTTDLPDGAADVRTMTNRKVTKQKGRSMDDPNYKPLPLPEWFTNPAPAPKIEDVAGARVLPASDEMEDWLFTEITKLRPGAQMRLCARITEHCS